MSNIDIYLFVVSFKYIFFNLVFITFIIIV